MPKQVAEASNEVSGMMEQAFGALEDSFKAAMKAQDDSVKFWAEAVGRAKPVQAATCECIPAAQKNADEYLRMLESSYRRNAELVKKAMQNPGDAAGMEKRSREWLDGCIEAARENTQELASTNLRAAQAWTEVIKKCSQQGAEFAQQSAQQGWQRTAAMSK